MSTVGYIHVSLEIWGSIICLIMVLCIFLNRKVDKKGSRLLIYMLLLDVVLLITDALAWGFRGDESRLGWYMVRISNYCVFVSINMILAAFTMFLSSRLPEEERKKVRLPLGIVYGICIAGVILDTISQFNHMFYYFDSQNFYHRGQWFMLTNVLALSGTVLDLIVLIKTRRSIDRRVFLSLLSYMVLPVIASIIQAFHYGLALNNLAITISMMFMFIMFQLEQSRQMLRQQEKINEMQIDIMLSQIGPHFLFNSLTTIKYLCKKDSEKAAEAVEEFSRFLRGNIDALSIKTCIPFSRELEHVKNYLALEQKRFGERLQTVFDIEEENFTIPALALQPLVENAVKHGVTKRPEGGTIRIETRKEQQVYTIKVIDDGVGFDVHSGRDDGRTHVGMDNVRQRLKLMCNGYVQIISTPGVGTEATVLIPEYSELAMSGKGEAGEDSSGR